MFWISTPPPPLYLTHIAPPYYALWQRFNLSFHPLLPPNSPRRRATIHLDGAPTLRHLPLVDASLPFWQPQGVPCASSRLPYLVQTPPFDILDLSPCPCQPQGFSHSRVLSSFFLTTLPLFCPPPLPATTGGPVPCCSQHIFVVFLHISSLVHLPLPSRVLRRLLVSSWF